MDESNITEFNNYKTLEDFGYKFNEEGKLRRIDPKTGICTDDGFKFEISGSNAKNQDHYNALGQVINQYIYQLLIEKGLFKIEIESESNLKSFFFASRQDIVNSKKILILIHGSGVVRAGQWARSLIINDSLKVGSQISYIEKAVSMGYDVLVMNTNENIINYKEIPGSESAFDHALSIFRKYLAGSNAKIAICAHSYGGVVVAQLYSKLKEFFEKNVFAVGFTDSVYTSPAPYYLRKISRNWVTSNVELDTEFTAKEEEIRSFSAGHTKHEMTSASCIEAFFKFLKASESQLKEAV